MQIPIKSITVKHRARSSLGDLASLRESMRELGLLNPIVVTERHELVAGHRRLAAAQQLGWETIEATVVKARDEADLLAMEIDENLQRLDFSPEELARAQRRLEKLRHPTLLGKLFRILRRFIRWLFEKT
ncbi:MAG: ParB/RepB/Spo0J family partition protein [Desulfobacterota bacterium]|nr:ParB/RepB/Spo0J family partition protein [Thermodesulfobacteriota bacterium]